MLRELHARGEPRRRTGGPLWYSHPMMQHQEVVTLDSPGRGLHLITSAVAAILARSGIRTGLCHLFIRHTSASLVIQENADPSARHDLERWFDRIAPENDPAFTHNAEGPDDMPAHLKTAVTSTSETIPIVGGRLGLGTWQGIYLFEHRRGRSRREMVVHLVGE